VSRTASPTLGVDLGATKVAAAVVDAEGRAVASHVFPTKAEKGPEGIIDDITVCVQDMLRAAGGSAEGVGIGVPGQIDAATGAVRFAPNLGWRDVPLRDVLERSLGLPVVVTNDVRAATWGEWKHGAGQGIDDLVMLFIGTGVGGGIISGGRVLVGCTNTAGELGHLTIVAGGRPCHCRNRGCLEAYVGGWAIAEQAREAVARDPQAGRLLLALAGDAAAITTYTVGDAYARADPLTVRLVGEVGRHLASGIVGVVNALNPCLVILGGGVIEGLPELVALAERLVRAQAIEAAVGELRIVRAGLGRHAGVIGAASLARHALEERT
jgi:glucokinase